jgi:hypothetical protein
MHVIVVAVFGRKNNLTESMELPKVVVISFHMLARLRESMLSRKWGMVIVDEAHNLRCTRKKVECDEVCLVSIHTLKACIVVVDWNRRTELPLCCDHPRLRRCLISFSLSRELYFLLVHRHYQGKELVTLGAGHCWFFSSLN